ncbi:MAG: multiple antibiotic resistance protein [Planctomycetota bacterium]|jgi:multiple antibiotic resistance protein
MEYLKQIITLSLTLFAVIDIIGSIPILIDVKKRQGHIKSEKIVLFSFILLLSFLFLGDSLLNLIGLDVESFAIAGAIVIFLLGLEMILGIEIFKEDPKVKSATIVPIAFPLIAGAGSITTVISLQAEYEVMQIFIGIVLNLSFVYVVLKAIPWIEGKIGDAFISILRRIFGVLLIAIAVKIFTMNINLIFP